LFMNEGICNVDGKINAIGTEEKNIIFTLMNDSAYGGTGVIKESDNWNGININSTGEFNGDNIKVRYGRNIAWGSNYAYSISVSGVKFSYSEISNPLVPEFIFNTLVQPTLSCNSFVNNDYAVFNNLSSQITINAAYNYWGTVYGPAVYNKTINAWIGTVNKISDGVIYNPGLGEELKYQFHFGENGANGATGNYSKSFTDMNIPYAGNTLSFTRTYNSLDNREESGFGKGWNFSFESNVTEKEYGKEKLIIVRLPDSSIQTFNKMRVVCSISN